MGAKLVELYTMAEKEGGLKAKLKMAMFTKMSLNAAEEAPDSPENIKLFQDALQRIRSSAD